MAPLHYKCTTPHYIQQLCVRWPLQPLQPFRKTQLQPPFGPSVYSLCQPWFTTTNLSYSFPIQNFRHHLVRHYLYTKLYQAINQSINIYIYTLNFLDYIWYSLEHTGNARTYRGFARTYQDNASNIPGSYERLYQDWPKGYIPGYWPKARQDIFGLATNAQTNQTMDNFLGNGDALASLSWDIIGNAQRTSARN